jgi:hypothetical protein
MVAGTGEPEELPGRYALAGLVDAQPDHPRLRAHCGGRAPGRDCRRPLPRPSEPDSGLVGIGADSIEHGQALGHSELKALGTRGGAWTPTLCAVLQNRHSPNPAVRTVQDPLARDVACEFAFVGLCQGRKRGRRPTHHVPQRSRWAVHHIRPCSTAHRPRSPAAPSPGNPHGVPHEKPSNPAKSIDSRRVPIVDGGPSTTKPGPRAERVRGVFCGFRPETTAGQLGNWRNESGGRPHDREDIFPGENNSSYTHANSSR